MTTKRNSPCIGYCENNETLGVCEGCFRTLEEIAMWQMLSEEEQDFILKDLPLRRKKILKGLYGEKLKEKYHLS